MASMGVGTPRSSAGPRSPRISQVYKDLQVLLEPSVPRPSTVRLLIVPPVCLPPRDRGWGVVLHLRRTGTRPDVGRSMQT